MDKKVYSIKQAAIINAIGKYSKVILSIVVEVVLARLLTPHDYGVVAVVTVFTTFFAIFSDMGLGTAVIQRKDLTKDDINQIYTFSTYLAVVLAILFFFASYAIAAFYGNKVYVGIGQLLSISLFFDTMNMVPNGVLNRNKEFVMLAVRTLVVYVLSVVVTIALAFFGARYYALVIQSILSSFFTFVWNQKTTKLKFQRKYNSEPIKQILGYSGFQFLFNLLNYFSRNLDNLLAGKFIGSTQLGYYNKAYTLMQYPVSNLSGVITPVLHPILSDYQNDKEALYKKYMNVVKLQATVGIWAEAICIFCGPEIIHIMYGSRWNESIICFQLLAISVATQMINSSVGAPLQALGNTRLLFISGVINTCITVIAILIGIFSGKTIFSLALWVSLSFIVNFIVSFYMLIRFGFKKKFSRFIKDMIPYFLVGIVVATATAAYPLTINNSFVSLVVKSLYITAFFLLVLFLSGEGSTLMRLIRK